MLVYFYFFFEKSLSSEEAGFFFFEEQRRKVFFDFMENLCEFNFSLGIVETHRSASHAQYSVPIKHIIFLCKPNKFDVRRTAVHFYGKSL